MNARAHKPLPFATLLAALLAAVFILSLAPIASAARYAAPESDDLLYGTAVQRTYAAERSLGAAVEAACAQVSHHHAVAHGRFSNTFFGALYLGLFGLNHYGSVPLLMIASLIVGVLCFGYALIVRVLGGAKSVWLALSLLVLLFYVQLLPSPAEGLFWFCGGLGYTLSFSGTLTLFALLLLLECATRRGARTAYGAIAVLTACVLSGLGFTLMLATGALLLGYVARAALQKRRAALAWGLATLLVFAAGSIVQLTAPAVSVRAGWEQALYGYAPMGLVQAVAASFAYAFGVLVHGLDGGMLAFMALSIALCAPLLARSPCRFRLPLAVLAGSFCLYATLFTASLYATSTMGPYRQRNVMYFCEFLFWGFNAAYCAGWWLRRRASARGQTAMLHAADAVRPFLDAHRLGLVAATGVLLLASVMIRGVPSCTSVAALREVRDGSAAARRADYAAERETGAPQGERAESRLYLY